MVLNSEILLENILGHPTGRFTAVLTVLDDPRECYLGIFDRGKSNEDAMKFI